MFSCLDTFQTTTAFNNVHSQIWKGLTTLEHDIFPDVSTTAQKLTKYIRQKVSKYIYTVCIVVFLLIFINHQLEIGFYFKLLLNLFHVLEIVLVLMTFLHLYIYTPYLFIPKSNMRP